MATLAPIKVPIIGEDKYTKAFQQMMGKVNQLGQAVTRTGKTLTASLTAPIVGVGIAGLKMSKDFNQAMASVGSLIPGQRQRLQGMKEDVLGLASETGKASTVIAEGLYETISAFGDAENPINKLRTATQMSVAGMSTVKEALSLVSAVTKGYGDTSDEAAQKVSDLSFLTVKLGQTTFPQLAASIGKVIPLAATLGIKQEELFTGFATLTGVTGNAAEVSTQLESAMSAFIKPSGEMTRSVKKLGYESSVTMVKELGLVKSLQKLQTLTGGDEIALGKLLTRKEGLNAALTILNKQSDTFAKKLTAMHDPANATGEAYKEMTEGINKAGFAFDRFIEKAKILAIKIGDKLAPVLLRLLEKVEPLIDKISNLSDESLELGIKIAGAVALIGPALIVIGKLISLSATAASFIAGSGGLGAALAALSGPVGIAIAAVAGITAAVVYFWDELEPLRTALIEPIIRVFDEFRQILSFTAGDMGGLTSMLKGLVGFLAELIAPVVKFGLKLALLPLRHIIRVVRIMIDVLAVLGSAFNTVSKVIKLGIVWLKNLWNEYVAGTVVGEGVITIFDAISDAVSSFVDTLKNAWQYVSGFFEDIRDTLDAWGMQLDKAIVKQEKLADTREGISVQGEEWNLDQSVMQSIAAGQTQNNITINMENTPEGVRIKSVEGDGKTRVKPQGATAEGYV